MAQRFTSVRWGAATLIATSALLLAQARVPEASAQARCFGLTATEYAAAGYITADFSGGQPASFQAPDGSVAVIGSPGDDSISAGGGATSILIACGKGGADFIIGSAGHDQIKGGPGDDRLFGAVGKDLVKGGAGNDVVDGFGGGGGDGLQDTVNGGAGLDSCQDLGEDSITNCESLST